MHYRSQRRMVCKARAGAFAFRFRFAHVVIFLAALTCFSQSVQASAKNHHRQKFHPVQPVSVSDDVLPSPEIDLRVEIEVATAKQILDNLDSNNFLASPYLVSAIYYHDDFLTDFPVELSTAEPGARIVGRISRMLTPEVKARFVSLLQEIWTTAKPEEPAQFVVPVDYLWLGVGPRAHQDALDMFTPEGTSVYSATRGVVILADSDWSPDDPFSTASRKGGNAVIVFDPDNYHFYRYAHLSTVSIYVGEIVLPGQMIGSVGHTGLNASQPGHGNHLHFEINEYLYGHVRAMGNGELSNMVQSWRITP